MLKYELWYNKPLIKTLYYELNVFRLLLEIIKMV